MIVLVVRLLLQALAGVVVEGHRGNRLLALVEILVVLHLGLWVELLLEGHLVRSRSCGLDAGVFSLNVEFLA